MDTPTDPPRTAGEAAFASIPERQKKLLYWACFISLVATSCGFIIRALVMGNWAADFDLSATQRGEIFGVGLWPFAISIVLFSLVIDRIGYGKAMAFAFTCHVVSAIVTISANGYWGLYIGTLILALGNGTVEAVINPLVATMYPKEKTKWLTILHAGWPAGLVLGGIIVMLLGPGVAWEWKVGLVLIPTVIYGVMLLRCIIPTSERVAAGVSYRAMLQEAGILGAFVVVVLIVLEVGRVFQWSWMTQLLVGAVLVGAYGAYAKALGRWMFLILVLIHIPLAITELGTDSWITELMSPVMGHHAGWVLVYTSFIMMVLRFFAGPIVRALTPLGLLAASSALAALALVFLSYAAGFWILAAATIYGAGKAFFWPVMLGIVAEQCPKGGALTLNAIAAVGMLGVGVIGAPLLGHLQDREIDRNLAQQHPQLHQEVVGPERASVFGRYQPLESASVAELGEEERTAIARIADASKQSALRTVALFPLIMLVSYILLILYFRSKGGYKPHILMAAERREDGG